MQQVFNSHQFTDADGNPAGGQTFGPGFSIAWQNGPLATGVDQVECIIEDPDHDGPCRRDPNGAFVETIIAAAKDRLEFYQSSKFACDTNAEAIAALDAALAALHRRTADREARNVEGTHQA